jgi:hypothetical protein
VCYLFVNDPFLIKGGVVAFCALRRITDTLVSSAMDLDGVSPTSRAIRNEYGMKHPFLSYFGKARLGDNAFPQSLNAKRSHTRHFL